MCSPRSTNEISPRSRGASCSCRSSSSSSTSSPTCSMRKLILASLSISAALAAQTPPARPRATPLKGSLERGPATLLDQPPFHRANWGLYVVDDRGKVLFERNGDRFYVPASNTKLVVSAAATVLLPVDYRVKTSLYMNGRMDNGVLHGDLVLYGRGDPTWSERCFSVDSLAPGACDSAFTAIDAVADSLRARGLKRVTGKLVGDGSYFEPTLVHPGWNAWDLNWWYAAPVSGLGFHDNSVDFHIAPGGAVDQPPSITWTPDLALFTFENRARTVPADSSSPVGANFFLILNSSQNWFAEMLLKLLGRELKGEGSWSAGLEVERRFLIDSVRIDSTAFALEDGSGLAAGNLVTPRAFAQLLAYMHRHPKRAPFLAGLPYAGQPGSLLKRFGGTVLDGRVIAKTGSIDRVNSLSGFIEQPSGRTVTFSIQANTHAVPYQQMLAQIDSIVVEIGKTSR